MAQEDVTWTITATKSCVRQSALSVNKRVEGNHTQIQQGPKMNCLSLYHLSSKSQQCTKVS